MWVFKELKVCVWTVYTVYDVYVCVWFVSGYYSSIYLLTASHCYEYFIFDVQHDSIW